MIVYLPLPSVDRLDLFGHPEDRDIAVYDGSELLGHVFPAVVTHPERGWFAKRPGVPAKPFDSKKAALEYLAGRPVNLEENR